MSALRAPETASAAPSTCQRCQQPLPAEGAPQRVLCDACRTVRRALTFINQAAELLGPQTATHDDVRRAYSLLTAARAELRA